MLVGSCTCSKCKQAFEMVWCVPHDCEPLAALKFSDWAQHCMKPGDSDNQSAGYCTFKVCGLRRRSKIFKVPGISGALPYVFSSSSTYWIVCFSKIIKTFLNLILIHGGFVMPSGVNSQMLYGCNVWTCGNIFFVKYSKLKSCFNS
jgi:hypothetical protein